jgi:ParB/RepB/Spo0J family partition protein
MSKRRLLDETDFAELTHSTAGMAEQPALGGMGFLETMLSAGGKTENGYLIFDKTTRYTPGAFVRVPLEYVSPNPRNPRAFATQADLDTLERSIRHSGQLEPAKAFYIADDDSHLMLHNGWRRYQCLSNIKYPTIDVQIVARAGDTLEEYRQARDINVESKAHTHFDDAVRFPLLMQEHGLDAKAFARRIGMAEAEVSKRVRIGKALPEEVLAVMADAAHVFGVEASYRLAQIADIKGATGIGFVMDLVKQMRADDSLISARYLRDLVERLKANADTATARAAGPRRNQPIARTELAGPLSGNVRMFRKRIEANLEGLSPELRDELYQAIVEVLHRKGLTRSSDAG